MEQYISKDALVAEIEKLKGKVNDVSSFSNGWQQALRLTEISINTLEVKEVDLEKKEIIDKACWYLNNNRLGVIDDNYIKEFRKTINN